MGGGIDKSVIYSLRGPCSSTTRYNLLILFDPASSQKSHTLNQERLTLATAKPLKDGSLYRRFRFVGHDDIFDLTQYEELYTPDRKLLARIDPAQERMP